MPRSDVGSDAARTNGRSDVGGSSVGSNVTGSNVFDSPAGSANADDSGGGAPEFMNVKLRSTPIPDKKRVQFYVGESYHVRPGYWKFAEKLNMVLVELVVDEDHRDETTGDVFTYVGRVPNEVFPGMPPRAIKFEGLTCPIEFDGVLALTTTPSKLRGGKVLHYSPVTSFLFYVNQSDGGQRVVHQNLETVNYKLEKYVYSFSPEAEYLMTVFDERYEDRPKSRKTFRKTVVMRQLPENGAPELRTTTESATIIASKIEENTGRKTLVIYGEKKGRNTRKTVVVQGATGMKTFSNVAPALNMLKIACDSDAEAVAPGSSDNAKPGRRPPRQTLISRMMLGGGGGGNVNLRKPWGTIAMARDRIRRTVLGVSDSIERRCAASPLISGGGLQYKCKTIIRRDKALMAEFHLKNNDLPPGAPLVFLTRLKLSPCDEDDVTMDSKYVQMRTTRRVVIIFMGHFWTAVRELFGMLIDEGTIKPGYLAIFAVLLAGVTGIFFGSC